MRCILISAMFKCGGEGLCTLDIRKHRTSFSLCQGISQRSMLFQLIKMGFEIQKVLKTPAKEQVIKAIFKEMFASQ